MKTRIGEGVEINEIEFSVSSIEIEGGRAVQRACSPLDCLVAIRCFIDVFDIVLNFTSKMLRRTKERQYEH